MITLTYRQINEAPFHSGMTKLTRAPLPIKLAYSVKKLAEDLDKERKHVHKAFMDEILAQFSEKDAEGNPLKEGEHIKLDLSKKEEFDAKEKEFGDRTFTINRHKLSVDQLEGHVKFTAQEVAALEPILSELSLVETEPAPPAA